MGGTGGTVGFKSGAQSRYNQMLLDDAGKIQNLPFFIPPTWYLRTCLQVGNSLNIIFFHQLLLLRLLCLKRCRTTHQAVVSKKTSSQLICRKNLHLHMPLILRPAELVQMYLIRPICDPQRPLVYPHPREREILGYTRSAVSLDRTIHYAQGHTGDEHLRLRNHAHCALGVGAVNLVGGL